MVMNEFECSIWSQWSFVLGTHREASRVQSQPSGCLKSLKTMYFKKEDNSKKDYVSPRTLEQSTVWQLHSTAGTRMGVRQNKKQS